MTQGIFQYLTRESLDAWRITKASEEASRTALRDIPDLLHLIHTYCLTRIIQVLIIEQAVLPNDLGHIPVSAVMQRPLH